MTADLVERGESLARLERCMAEAGRNGGRIALVAGEAGIGKTSVLRAFARTRPEAAVWWGACDALHVWMWQPNRSGMFADWNPSVRCP